MKKADLKERSSVFYISKGVIFISIIITSSLSFALGFFVGKSMHPSVASQTSVAPEQNVITQTNPEPAYKESDVRQPAQYQVVQEPSKADETQKPQETLKAGAVHDANNDTKNRIEKQPRETKTNQQTSIAPQDQKTQQTREISKPQHQKQDSEATKYAVQTGAFRNSKDANTLKTKLAKKGYKVHVISETKNHQKIYKVLAGEFDTRKEADLLSIKLKKAEGLHTFVILRTD